jgi:hypothetical protein
MMRFGRSKFALGFLALNLLCVVFLPHLRPVVAAQEVAHADSNGPVKSGPPASLWHDPGDICSLNLEFGQGGKDHAPQPGATYKFVKEDLHGTSPKFYVKDQNGVEWLVKVGQEARPENAATRLVWAMGFFTDEDYFLPELRVADVPKLHRKNRFVRRDGTVIAARLKRKVEGQKKTGNWDWFDNPFLKTRELNGLRVMMALLNNWDLKTDNNKIYGDDDKDVHYVVSDLGASFGRTGAYSSRSKGRLKSYEQDKFILKANAESVDFVMRTKPSWVVRLIKGKYYRQKLPVAGVVQNIPRQDAKWIGEQLSRLSTDQVRSAFMASGFRPDEVDGYTKELQKRIAELKAL